MALGLRETRTALRRQRRAVWFKRLTIVVALALLGGFAYQTGSLVSEKESARLRTDVAQLTRSVDQLKSENAQLRVDADAARLREAEWRKRYEAEVPSGSARKLSALLQEKLAAKVDPNRLQLLIDSAGAESACEGKPQVKRFLVRTPVFQGANDAVTFANNAITVTAEGHPKKDNDGKPQGWFDPADAVTVTFTALGGRKTQASGPLPLYHSVVVNDAEYRFSVVPAESRGFVTVTGDRCKFP